jgi:threonine dehydrogenase-like Zn-dependent dehydrogenase
MDWLSDLHTYRGIEPSPPGPIMGHEFMGEIVEVGSDVTALQKGDRVVSAFTTSWYFFQSMVSGNRVFISNTLKRQVLLLQAGFLFPL